MANFNRVTLIGNLTRDPQLKQLPSGSPCTELTLATNRRFKASDGQDREEVCFVDCAAFGKQADVLAQYCRKGRPLLVEGRLKYDAWDDKSGAKRTKLSVVVENFQFLNGRGEEDGEGRDAGPVTAADRHGDGESSRKWRNPQQRLFAPRGKDAADRKPPEQPFGEEKQFTEAEIPF